MELGDLTAAIIDGKRDEATDSTRAAIAAGLEPQRVLDAMVAAMDEVGRRFQCGSAFMPEMLLASRAMKEAMALLEPLLVAAGVRRDVRAVLGTVHGDLHDIGKNLVAMMWRGANFDVVDLGTNVTARRFVDAVREHGARIVGLSALLTTTLPAMRDIVRAIREADMPAVKVVVGGAPVTEEFADRIGADGYAPDAPRAVEVARRLAAS